MDATVVVTDVQPVGSDTIAISFRTPAGFEALPGQFVKLAATVDGEEYARFYTLSSPDVADTVEVTVGVDPDEAGPFSRHLADLSPGDELDMTGPFGENHYEGEARVVVVAGGPGIGPAVGIGERAHRDGNEVAIVYRDTDPAHTARLDDLREAGATVTVTDGPLADPLADVVTGAPGEQVFVYGFDDFVDEAREAVAAAGGDPDDAKVENFG
ncbi:MAG: FAD-dependent oxidoreductase [Halobacterium sp.]